MNLPTSNYRLLHAAAWLGLAFAVLAPVLFLPAFGSDGDLVVLPAGRFDLLTSILNIQWTRPPVLGLLLQAAQFVFGTDAIIALRGLGLMLYIVNALLLARLARSRGGEGWVMALASLSPIAFQALSILVFLPLLIAVLTILLAIIRWRQHRREAALALLILAFALISSHTAPTQALFNLFIVYAIWLILALVVGVGLHKGLARVRTAKLRVVFGLLGVAIVGSSAWVNVQSLSLYRQVTSTWRALGQLQVDYPARVLNAPARLTPPTGLTLLWRGDGWIIPDDPIARLALAQWPYERILDFAQVIEGPITATQQINDMPVTYEAQPQLSRVEALAQIHQHEVVLAGRVDEADDGTFMTRIVGGFQTPNTPSQYVARFESGDNVILLTKLEMCAPNGLSLTLQVLRGRSPTVTLFRHALRDSQQLAGNDTGLVGGFVDLSEVKPGEQVHDISYFPASGALADSAKIGLYDWQSGQRWLAVHANGAQWAENAVSVARPAKPNIQACGRVAGSE